MPQAPFIARDEYEFDNERGFMQGTKFTIHVHGLTPEQAGKLHSHLVSETKFRCEVFQKGGNPNAD